MLVILKNEQIEVISRALMFENLERVGVERDLERREINQFYLDHNYNKLSEIERLFEEGEILSDNEDKIENLDRLGMKIVFDLANGINDINLTEKKMNVIFCALIEYRKTMINLYYNGDIQKEKIEKYKAEDIATAFRLSFIMHRMGIWPFVCRHYSDEVVLNIIRNPEYWENEYEIVTETINIFISYRGNE